MRHIITLSFLALTMQLHAQTTTIIGTWQLDINRTTQLMEGAGKTSFENIPSEKQSEIKQSFSQRTFRFLESGDFEVQWYDGKKTQSANGKWVIENQNVIITVNSKESEYSIRELNTNQLALEKVDGREGLFKNLAFNRQ